MRFPFTMAALALLSTAAHAGNEDPEVVAEAFLATLEGQFGRALDPVLLSRYRSESTGITHLCYRQTVEGIPVHNGDLLVNIGRDGKLVNWHGTPGGTAAVGGGHGSAPAEIVGKAAEMIGAADRSAGGEMASKVAARGAAAKVKNFLYSGGDLSADPIPVDAVWFRKESGELVRAWHVLIRTKVEVHGWDVIIEDGSGKELRKTDRISGAGSYEVVPYPFTSPDEEPLQIVPDTADALASPFGWHDTNGVAGAEFTDTRGNNVSAQEDSDGNDTGGFRPSGGSGLNFLVGTDALAERRGNIISLFHTTNVCHDILYRYGFNEAAGNFQTNNYGRGGTGNDAVLADSEEEAAAGNAFFFPTVEGVRPVMEFGIQNSAVAESLVITSPAAAAKSYPTRGAGFGSNTGNGGIPGQVVAALDAANATGPTTTDACTALTNAAAVNGKIALIDRGTCNFTVKVKNAQDAGAIGVIMVNNAGNGLVTMSGNDPLITIPSVFIGQADGQLIRSALAGSTPVNATLTNSFIRKNTASDKTIVIHEYVHGVSNRLTGGPAATPCLNGAVPGGLGEGWSDFIAIALTTKDTDDRTTPRKIGAFAFGSQGIRTFPYSTSQTVNPHTYASIRQDGEVHFVGEVWCAMLWDLYWDLTKIHGRAADVSAPFSAGGGNLAIQLVIDGMKLQPCSPSFTDARDAILTADQALTGGENVFAIWNAFARRGLGVGATEGFNQNDTAVIESFAVPQALDMADDDLDGTANLLETALGANPSAADPDLLPELTMVEVAGDVFPAIRYRRLAGGSGVNAQGYSSGGITYQAEYSTDLLGFTAPADFFETVEIVPSGEPGVESVTLRTKIPIDPASPKQFLRLRISRSNGSSTS